jgi:NodT family efflux transporter outer membrane factor (OMF) lipoprotein
MLLVQPGCGIPKLHKAEPAAPLPDSFNGATSAENSSYVGTSEFFNDPILTSLINQALANNQQLRILAQDIAIANNEVWRRSGSYLPFVTFGAGASLDNLSTYTPPGADLSQIIKPNGGFFPNPLPDFMMAANVSWQIDIWRQLRNSRDAQGLRYLGTTDGWNYVVTRLVAEIAENYYTLMALDKQLETLDITILFQEQSLVMARSLKDAGQGSELGVQRFLAEVRMNQSQKLIIRQQIIETENRINFLAGRFPQGVPRNSATFLDLNLQALNVGVPAQLLQNRPDIRQAERNLTATGIDIRVARANFYPKLVITSGVGYEAYNPRYIFFTPESLIYNVAGGLVAPLVNKRAIQADYMNANAKQLQALYEYQRTILNAFTEVINRVSKAQNYSISIQLKRQQLEALEESVTISKTLFQNAQIEYLDVLTALRDRLGGRIALIDTKKEQLSAVVNAYQALGGGWRNVGGPAPMIMPIPQANPWVPGNLIPANRPPAGPPAEQLPAPPPGPVIQGPAIPGPAIQGPAIQGPVPPSAK